MNMASFGILLFIFTVIHISAGFAKAFVNLHCKTENWGQYGQESLLDCVIKTTLEVQDFQIRVVTWKKEGDDEPVLVFHKGKTEKQKGYSFAEPSWNSRSMNVSLRISNTAVKDNGGYECMVITNSGEATRETSLKVTAKYSVPTITPIPQTIALTTGGTLECNSVGGYPEGKIYWFGQQGEDWTKSAKLEVKQTENGLFQLTSRLSLLQGSIFPEYTCRVFNASGGKEEEATVKIPNEPEGRTGVKKSDTPSKIVAPVVVIGSLIVGLLLALLIYRRRTRQARRHSTAPLMADHHEVPPYEPDSGQGVHQEMEEKHKGNPV